MNPSDYTDPYNLIDSYSKKILKWTRKYFTENIRFYIG